MAIFFNQASISYGGFVTNSNTASGEVLDTLAVTKSAISTGYGPSGGAVYAISLVNSGTTVIGGITVSDDLGAYPLGDTTVVPLDYVEGSATLYVNGTPATTPTVTAGPPLTFTGINLPAGASALLLYEVSANGYAPLAAGSSISNTATVNAEAPCVEGPIEATADLAVRSFTALSIAKCISPDTVSSCEEVTYTFIIQNAGNEAVPATDDLVVSDTFTPALSNLDVSLNGTPLAEGTGYTYDETTGLFTTIAGQIAVPAATFTRDPITGAVTTTPGVAILTVTGII